MGYDAPMDVGCIKKRKCYRRAAAHLSTGKPVDMDSSLALSRRNYTKEGCHPYYCYNNTEGPPVYLAKSALVPLLYLDHLFLQFFFHFGLG